MSKGDTRIRRMTKPGANLFAELGFPQEEAQLYQAQSRALISQTLAVKEQLMGERASRTEGRHLMASRGG